MTVKQLLNSLDSAEIAEWQAFFSLDKYEEKLKQERMTDDERSDAIIKTIFKGVKCHKT